MTLRVVLFPKELYRHFYNQEYVAKYPPILFQESLPDGIADAAKCYQQWAHW